MIALNSTLPRFVVAPSSSEADLSSKIKPLASSIGRVKLVAVATVAGYYDVTLNGSILGSMKLSEGSNVYALPYRPQDEDLVASDYITAVLSTPCSIDLVYDVTSDESESSEDDNALPEPPSEIVVEDKEQEEQEDEDKEQDDEILVAPVIGASPKAFSASPMFLGATPSLAATVPKTILFSNTNSSGAGSLRAAVLSANPGDTIEPSEILKAELTKTTSESLVINYPYDAPLGGYTIRSTIPGKKITLDFNGAGGATVVTNIDGSTFEDVVFLNMQTSGGSYGVIQFGANATGTISFKRCGFAGCYSTDKPIFRHSSASTSAKLSFTDCVAIKDANATINAGWFAHALIIKEVLNTSFNNNGLVGIPLYNTTSYDVKIENVVTTVSATYSSAVVSMATSATASASTFAILDSTTASVSGGSSEGLDYFGYQRDGTLGAVSGGKYLDYSSKSSLSGFIGVENNVANITSYSNTFTYNRLDRDITGKLTAVNNESAGLFQSSEPLDEDSVKATRASYVYSVTRLQGGYMVDFITSDLAYYESGERQTIAAVFTVSESSAESIDVKINGGLDDPTILVKVAPTVYYKGTSETISSLLASDWSLEGFEGAGVSSIDSLANAAGYTFAVRDNLTFRYAGATNYKKNKILIYDKTKTVKVYAGALDVTEELVSLGLIKYYVADSYLDRVFEDLVEPAVYALDVYTTDKEERLRFFGE